MPSKSPSTHDHSETMGASTRVTIVAAGSRQQDWRASTTQVTWKWTSHSKWL